MSSNMQTVAVPAYAVQILHVNDVAGADRLATCCLTAGYPVHAAAVPDISSQDEREFAQLIIVCGTWNDPRVPQTVETVTNTLPCPVVLLYVPAGDALPDLLREAGVFGVLTADDSMQTVGQWVAVAMELAGSRFALAALQRRMQRWQLREDDEREATIDPLPALLHVILDAAMAVVRYETPRAVCQPLSGAVLLAEEDGRLPVKAACGSLSASLHRTLPEPLQGYCARAMEHRTLTADGRHLVIPLSWGSRTRGVLVLTGTGLPCAVSGVLGSLVTQASAFLENTILHALAAVDSTTEALSRTFTLRRLYEMVKAAYRSGRDLTVLMLDLDRFKQINDSLGHLVGDRVLREAAMVMQMGLRDSDILGRYGGDEFLVILPDTAVIGGLEAARRIREGITAWHSDVAETPVTVDISIGVGSIRFDEFPWHDVASRTPHDVFQHAVEMLIDQADGHLYRAKHDAATHISSGMALSWSTFLTHANEGSAD